MEEDEVELSAETMKALQEFLQEKSERESKMKEFDTKDVSSLTFGEDWQLSQFWYDDETAVSLAKVAITVAKNTGNIALISCPTIYKHIKSLGPEIKVSLFEYDKRFAVFGEDFLMYDYRSPLDIPRDLASQFDVVIMDPPFLSEECLTKTAVTAKFLAKDKIVLCTGSVMEDLARRLLDMKKCTFKPRHQNNLANEFCCYSNFDFDTLLSSTNKIT